MFKKKVKRILTWVNGVHNPFDRMILPFQESSTGTSLGSIPK